MRSLFTKVAVRPAVRRVAANTTATAALLRRRVVSATLLKTPAPLRHNLLAGLYATRAFATKGSAPAGGAAPSKFAAPVPVQAPKPSPAAQLQAVKLELASLIAKEADEVGDMPADHPYSQYVKDNGLTITHEKKDGDIIITKSIHGYNVTVKFSASPDPDQNEDDAEGEDEDGKRQAKTEEEGGEDEESYNYSFVVSVKANGAAADAPTLNVFAVSSKDNKLYFEGLSTSSGNAPTPSPAATSAALSMEGMGMNMSDYPEVDYNDLPTAVQDKIADFMDLLKIDDEFAQFVPAVAAEVSRSSHQKQLAGLKAFIALPNNA